MSLDNDSVSKTLPNRQYTIVSSQSDTQVSDPFIKFRLFFSESRENNLSTEGREQALIDHRTSLFTNSVADKKSTSTLINFNNEIQSLDENRKRKRSANDTNNLPAGPITPVNPALKKHVTFSFQNNNNGSEDKTTANTDKSKSASSSMGTQPSTSSRPSGPTQPETTQAQGPRTSHDGAQHPASDTQRRPMEEDTDYPPPAPEDPTRNYQVIPGASDMWRMAMTCRRAAARDHARICILNRHLDTGCLPLWAYGMAPAPDWLKPFPLELVNLIERQAKEVTELTRHLLRVQLATAERQANRHMTHTREVYQEEKNNDFHLAEGRLNGIVNHYRTREQAILQRRFDEDGLATPTNNIVWAENLPKRKVPPAPSATRTRSRSRSRGRNGPRARGRGNSGPRNRSRTPPARPSTSRQATNRQPPSRDQSQDSRAGPSSGNNRGRSRGPARRRGPPQDLSPEEQALIDALRSQKSKQPRK